MNTTDLDFVIDTSPLAKWVPFEGDGDAALLSRDGDYKVRVEKITPKNSKKGLGMLRVVGSIADEGDPDFGEVEEPPAGPLDNRDPTMPATLARGRKTAAE